jgi:tetratricopeptide (TPR) repeat protein
MTISLCMICYNEEGIIERCLATASDAFDELCLVRAIGENPPDNTVEIARRWCAANGKQFKSDEYINVRLGLKHTDNFGNARQKSFNLATGDWLLWLDCDDYMDELNCRRIREAVSVSEHDALFCSYLVENQGAEILRERLIRRGCGQWRRAIHETCDIKGTSANCPQIQVFHSDHKKKHKSSAERNAVILQEAVSDAPRHYFYLHAELKMMGKTAEAKSAALAALALLPESSTEERYLVLLNLSELDTENREQHLHAAARIQPHRREAFAYLTQKALMDGRTSDAISWFRCMDSLPLPSPLPWTHQGMWYGWARNWLRVRILTACGKIEQAEEEHEKYLADSDYAREIGNLKS